ncbi:MAG: hypothetical protein HQ559_05320, partial [Lentisphaerae bacterium]|nr:hypothetical protein [Lentisphaerota bacterium]
MLRGFRVKPVLFGASRALAYVVVAAAVIGWTLPAYSQPSPYVEGEVLIRFKKSVSTKRARAAAVALGLSVRRTYPALSARKGRAYLHCRSRKTTAELVADLGRHPLVDVVVPNYIKTVSAPSFPTDPEFTDLWGLHNTGQTVDGAVGTSDADIDYPEAWELSRPPDANEVIVAVIDTGVDYNHPDLAANMWTNPGENPTNALVVRWSSVTNKSYSLLRSANLMDGFATNATGITATAPENVYTDSTVTLPG